MEELTSREATEPEQAEVKIQDRGKKEPRKEVGLGQGHAGTATIIAPCWLARRLLISRLCLCLIDTQNLDFKDNVQHNVYTWLFDVNAILWYT